MSFDKFPTRLNRRMAALSEPPDGEPPYWAHWRHQLWELGQAEDPARFMLWPPVFHCMLVNHWSMDYQLSQLQAGEWARWEAAIQATIYSSDADRQGEYSKDLINQAYHLLMWERCTGRRIGDLRSIVEVGGGYGAMALVCHRLGFRGRYTIYDLPEFGLLQQWFLDVQNVPAEWPGHLHLTGSDLLIGIYSLSEMPLDERARVLATYPAESYLLVYSGDWQEWDNRKWFADWAPPAYRWWHWRMKDENDRPDYYRVGMRRDRQPI